MTELITFSEKHNLYINKMGSTSKAFHVEVLISPKEIKDSISGMCISDEVPLEVLVSLKEASVQLLV